MSRAFSFSQDTPNKIKKTISSVFRSPFQTSYSQQSLNEQKSSKLTSLASLQLTPTLVENKRKFITLQNKPRDLQTQTSQLFTRHHTQTSITQTTSSLLSLDTCGMLMNENFPNLAAQNKLANSNSSLESTNSNKLGGCGGGVELNESELTKPQRRPVLMQHLPDVTNVFQTNSFKRQLS